MPKSMEATATCPDCPRLLVLEAILRRIEQQLFGNGHQGELADLREVIHSVDEKHVRYETTINHRLDKYDRLIWKTSGALAALLVIMNILMTIGLDKLSVIIREVHK